MPISDLFIVRRIQNDIIVKWKLFDAYKINYGFHTEIGENGIMIRNNSVNESNIIGANFSSTRRQNLKGVTVRSISFLNSTF